MQASRTRIGWTEVDYQHMADRWTQQDRHNIRLALIGRIDTTAMLESATRAGIEQEIDATPRADLYHKDSIKYVTLARFGWKKVKVSYLTMKRYLRASRACVLILTLLATSSAYRSFQALIPNGSKVPDPCRPGSTWPAVGHVTPEGGSHRNKFGKHFKAFGKTWTKALCQMDSDEDGRSNGEELGDRNCSWTPGTPLSAGATSHPGICEPLDSPKCKQVNIMIKCRDNPRENWELAMCEHIAKNSTFSLEVTLTPTPVPAEETVYTCQIIDLDLDLNAGADFHMVATQPVIKATEVVHHILLFGCKPGASVKQELKSPHRCAMAPDPACRDLIGAWTLGSPGECAHPDMGFRMGVKGYRTVALQVHWNNPRRLSGLTDCSGMKIHLTPDLRKYDAGMLVVGQRFMQIPNPDVQGPKQTEFSAVCPSHCTQQMFKTPIYITSAVNHMHYLGRHQSIKLYRNNTVDRVITDQDNWSYDDPLIYNFKQAIKVSPGHEIRTVCTYKQPSTSNPVCWGEATSDEMCFGFLTYYPRQSLGHPWCVSMKKFPSCERHLPALGRRAFDGCHWWVFRNISHPETRQRIGSVLNLCFPDHTDKLVCSQKCRDIAQQIVSHPCLKGETGSYMIDWYKKADPITRTFLDAIFTCSCSDFDYCDRKYNGGLLGSKRDEFCSSNANFSFQESLLWSLIFVTYLTRL
ncbi:hypothetical protein RRG08_047505 [Elysia crispata]|uniref:Uncharacterized protein n=1 Tax=Elysia crispata TaxID=231223 RepID=A0AAE1CND1_9GAST|nr:hypothetical protein RRG08_047505 [Elysia crispata]